VARQLDTRDQANAAGTPGYDRNFFIPHAIRQILKIASQRAKRTIRGSTIAELSTMREDKSGHSTIKDRTCPRNGFVLGHGFSRAVNGSR
jgi:hypothetical protein